MRGQKQVIEHELSILRTLNVRTERGELVVEMLITTVDVVEAVNLRFALGHESGEHQRG